MTRFTYAVTADKDTVWQYVVRSPVHFQSDIVIPKQGASVKLAAVDSAGLVGKLQIDIWRFPPLEPGSAWQHAQHAEYQAARDSVFGVVRAAGREQSQRFATPAGAMIFQWSYVALLEQLAIRARKLGGANTTIPVYFFGTSGFVLPATVDQRPGEDSVSIKLGKEEYRLLLDKFGRILSGSSGTTTIQRVPRRTVFPMDSSITRDLRCPEIVPSTDIAALRSDPAVGRILSLYPGAGRAREFRVLRNETDLSSCRDILDLFPPQGGRPQLVQLGDVYLMVVPASGGRTAVGVVSQDLSIAHLAFARH
jgi:hypothetical protein